jgi:hypothetical protein
LRAEKAKHKIVPEAFAGVETTEQGKQGDRGVWLLWGELEVEEDATHTLFQAGPRDEVFKYGDWYLRLNALLRQSRCPMRTMHIPVMCLQRSEVKFVDRLSPRRARGWDAGNVQSYIDKWAYLSHTAIRIGIMPQNEMPIPCDADIRFNGIGTELDGCGERGDGIFRSALRGTAMPDNMKDAWRLVYRPRWVEPAEERPTQASEWVRIP